MSRQHITTRAGAVVPAPRSVDCGIRRGAPLATVTFDGAWLVSTDVVGISGVVDSFTGAPGDADRVAKVLRDLLVNAQQMVVDIVADGHTITAYGPAWTHEIPGVADCPEHGLYPAGGACQVCLAETAHMVGEITRAPVVQIGGTR